MHATTTLHITLTPDTSTLTPDLGQEPSRFRYAPFKASDVTTAATRVAEVTAAHPSFPQARVRSTVAREMSISTVQLRYLLRRAAEQETTS
ncbi:MAG TPA: hypothetical protein VF598_07560 [Hymenobacter sp.]